MESKTSNAIKKEFQDYSRENNFCYHESEPLIAPEGSKLLFNISGGVKYQDELLGLRSSQEDRVSSIQKCIRTDGMKKIGYSGRHHIYFEMIGHFMFYCCKEKECKEEFIKFAYNFLVNELGIDKNRIFATFHPDDVITYNIWKSLGNNNLIKSDKNIFVSPYAEKSSLRTEILFQKDDEEKSLIELWNLVFTQFDSKELFKNPSQYIAADSGGSLDRFVSACENKSNNYENSMWSEFINSVKTLGSGIQIQQYRRIADFMNTIIKLIDEGVKPGNKVQSYMLRKMLRTLFDMCDDNNIDIKDVVLCCLKCNTINSSADYLLKVIIDERTKYLNAIKNGLKQLEKDIVKHGIENVNIDHFKSSYGLSDRYIRQILEESKKLSL